MSSPCRVLVAPQTRGPLVPTMPIEAGAVGIVGLAGLMSERPNGGAFEDGRMVAL